MSAVTAVSTIFSLFAFCTCGSCSGGRVAGDELVMLIEAPAQTLDPRHCVSGYDFKLSKLVYEPLVAIDEHLEPEMALAESVAMVSPTEYLVTLRDARFSDGRPVTTDDIVYTIESTRAQATNSLKNRYRDDGLLAMEPLDAKHLRLRLSHQQATFVTDLDEGIIARPAPGHEQDPPVGAGPFVPLAEKSDADHFRFRANPYYFRGAPPVKKLTVKVIRDDNARLLALAGGSADLTQNTIPPLLLDAVSRQPRLRLTSAPSSVYTYLGFNCDDPILGDARVRRAIAMAIDRERIVKTKFGGRATLSTGMLPPFHWAFAKDVAQVPYDPARARALLDEAGHPDPDGPGPRPRFTLIYKTSSNRFRVAVAQVLAAQLADVGIDIELHPLEFATFFADVKAGNFQLYSMQIPEVSEPDLYTNFFDSSRIPTRENPDRGGNRMRYRSPALDAALARGRHDLERAARIADYAEVQRIIARDQPVVSLWHEDNVAVMGETVRGYHVLPTALFTSLREAYKTR